MAQDTSTGSTGPAGSSTTKRRAAAKRPPTKRAAARSSKPVATPSKPAAKPTAKAPTAKPVAAKPAAKPALTLAAKAPSKRATTTASASTRAAVSSAKSSSAKSSRPAKSTASKAPAVATEVIVVPAAFDAHSRPMTPAVAVSRHVEWLDYALAAARAEETWRRGRLEKATRKNRSKRESRLAEVLGEIEELAALLIGLRGLQKGKAPRKPARGRSSGARRTRAGTPTTAARRATTGTGAG